MSDHDTTLGELISLFYEEFLATYGGDSELASVATAAMINDLLADAASFEGMREADAA